jgi:hypothetical protein
MVARCLSRSLKPGHPGEVAGGHLQDETGADPFDAAVDGLGKAADGLAQPKASSIRLRCFWDRA